MRVIRRCRRRLGQSTIVGSSILLSVALATATPDPDPVSSPPQADALTLEELLVFAESASAQLRQARSELALAEAEGEGAERLFPSNPVLEVSAGQRFSGGEAFPELEVSLEQAIEIGGERGLRQEAARLRQTTVTEEIDVVAWDLHVETHHAYRRVLLTRAQSETATNLLGYAQDLSAMAQRRVEAGEAPTLSMLLANGEVAAARERQLESQLAWRQAVLDLSRTVGWPTTEPLDVTGELPPVRPVAQTHDLLAVARANHPAFRLRGAQVTEAQTRSQLAQTEAWPELTVGLSYASEGDIEAGDDIWMFSLGVPLPLWDNNQGEVAERAAALQQANLEEELLDELWAAQLARARTEVDATAERAALYGSDILPTVEENLALIQRAYELGEIDLAEVSQTRERVLETQAEYLRAVADYYEALAGLESLLGTEVEAVLAEETP